MTTVITYRARLRFRLRNPLKIESDEYRFTIAGHDIVFTAADPDQIIQHSEWLIMNARGFPIKDEAREFGKKLRDALQISSIAVRLGVDAVIDAATSGMGAAVKEQLATQAGILMRDNIHGLDVFADDPRVRFPSVTGTLTVCHSSGPLPR